MTCHSCVCTRTNNTRFRFILWLILILFCDRAIGGNHLDTEIDINLGQIAITLATGPEGTLITGPEDAEGNLYVAGIIDRVLIVGNLILNLPNVAFVLRLNANGTMGWLTLIHQQEVEPGFFGFDNGVLTLDLHRRIGQEFVIFLDPETGRFTSSYPDPSIEPEVPDNIPDGTPPEPDPEPKQGGN
ncbi:MAG: hypothetical protein QNK37_37535 [Acidobacteriota bacterium]|nr:hypothetical protein [Acidobacteriota bacterium]